MAKKINLNWESESKDSRYEKDFRSEFYKKINLNSESSDSSNLKGSKGSKFYEAGYLYHPRPCPWADLRNWKGHTNDK